MKKILYILILLIVIESTAQESFHPEELVNTLMGSDSRVGFSNGNTYPALALPWGMNCWTPQTGSNGNGWQYQYGADRIRGFKQTHQPSPWIGDYGQFSIMPMTGKLRLQEEQRGSFFSHKAEEARPYYYSVYLADDQVKTEITATERAAIFRLTFPENDSSFILIDAFDRGSSIEIIPSQNKIIGYTTRNRGGVPGNFRNYFVIECDKAFNVLFAVDDQLNRLPSKAYNGNHAQAVIGFSTNNKEQVHLRVASSFISQEQAQLNLDRELGRKGFEEVFVTAKKIWQKELSKVRVEGGTEEQIRTFYSCLYRMLMFPRKFYEFDGRQQMVHYSPFNGKIESGYLFTDTGFWDTFRSLFPFLTLVYPEINSQMMQGLVNTYKESGWLPEWASPGHKKSMIGNNSASVIADAYLKGVRGFDIETLYEAMLKGTRSEGPINTLGRNGAEAYNKLGYVPADLFGGSAAKTLEYAYADFCISKLAAALKRPVHEIDTFLKRAGYYKNIFDTNHKLMRGRKADGTFEKDFNPFRWGFEFVEGNSWHYSWSVFQDFEGLSRLMGGHKMLERMLDSVFVLPPVFDTAYYKKTIHEMVEMQVMNMGQYAHGNQPIQHMLYIYNFCGAPWKTQYYVRDVMERFYKPTPDGYCGDEDNGQTSAWYVFSAMGFYPVCPGTGEYILGSPLFKKVTIALSNGKKFTIEAPSNNKGNVYIESASLNNKTMKQNYITHQAILQGGRLQFNMDGKPNLLRGSSSSSFPFSLTPKK